MTAGSNGGSGVGGSSCQGPGPGITGGCAPGGTGPCQYPPGGGGITAGSGIRMCSSPDGMTGGCTGPGGGTTNCPGCCGCGVRPWGGGGGIGLGGPPEAIKESACQHNANTLALTQTLVQHLEEEIPQLIYASSHCTDLGMAVVHIAL